MKPARRDNDAPATLVVFGRKGRGSAQAGLLGLRHAERAVQAAQQTGMTAVPIFTADLQAFDGMLPRGSFDRDHHLQLGTISAKLLTALEAMQRAQGSRKRRSVASGPPADASSVHAPTSPPPAQPPSGEVDFDASVLAAYRLLDQVWTWIERLSVELATTLSRIGKTSELSVMQEDAWPDLAYYHGGEGWLCNGWRWTYPVRHGRQRIGSLAIVADIGRLGRPAAALNQPCMLVTWSSIAHDWRKSIDAATGFWPPPANNVALQAERLFRWIGPTNNGPSHALPLRAGSWFYIVPLNAVRNLPKVRALLVQPAFALLAGSAVETAFATTPEVLRFERRKGDDIALLE